MAIWKATRSNIPRLFAGAIGLLIAATDGLAGERIACTVTSTYDFKTGFRWPAREQDAYVPGGIGAYTLPFPCQEGTVEARVSPVELRFSCEQRLRGGLFVHSAEINLVTGRYRKTFSRKRENGFVYTGSCVF